MTVELMSTTAMPPVRVIHLISSLHVGGAEVMLLAFLKAAIHSSTMQPVLVVLNDDYHPTLHAQALELGIPVHFINRPRSSKHPKYIAQVMALIAKHKGQVLHSHDDGCKRLAAICKLRYPQLKTTFTIHNTHIMDSLSSKEKWVHKLGVDGHVAISQVVAQECLSAGFSNVTTVYNGLDLTRFNYHSPRWQPDKHLKLIQIGRFDIAQKGQDILINAMALLRDAGLNVSCTLAGMAPDAEKQQAVAQLQQQTNDLGLHNHVKFWIDRTDVPAMLAEHDVFVLPSRFEGFGLVLVEAMAAGLPVIASRLDGPSELIQHQQNGLLFTPEDPSDLAAQLIWLTQHPEQFAQLAEQGQQKAQQFNITAMVNGCNQYYQSLLNPTKIAHFTAGVTPDMTADSIIPTIMPSTIKTSVMVGSDYREQGGIGTVLSIYLAQGFLADKHVLVSHREGPALLRIWLFLQAGVQLLWLCLTQPSVKLVHMHFTERGSFTRKAIYVALAHAFGRKTLLHLHGAEFLLFFQTAKPWLQRWIKHTLDTTEGIVVLSKSWRVDLAHITQNPNIFVVYNPIVIPEQSPSVTVSTTELTPKAPVRMIFLGRFGQRKGVFDLLNAVAQLCSASTPDPGFTIDLYGDGEIDTVRTMIDQLNLTSVVRVNGWIRGQAKHKVLTEADVLVLPSYNEGLPMAILEAMAYGLAVISSPVGGIAEAVTHGKNGLLVPAGDVTGLAQALQLLASQPQVLADYKAYGRQQAEHTFSHPVIFEQLNNVYAQVLGNGPSNYTPNNYSPAHNNATLVPETLTNPDTQLTEVH
jgi:glycosyltransferase involved in cell wall biosynthesis